MIIKGFKFSLSHFQCIFLILINFSCNDHGFKENKNIISQVQKTQENIEEKQKLLEIIHGGWVSKSYIEKVYTAKSIYAGLEESKNFAELIIDTNRTFLGDTIGNPGCLENDFEMNYFQIIFLRNNQKKLEMKVDFREGPLREDTFTLRYSIKDLDTTLFLYKANPPVGKELFINEYKRIYKNPPLNDYQINPSEAFIIDSLFNGNYTLYSNKGLLITDSIVFNKNENIQNFPGFNTFFLGNYFEGAPGCGICNFDYIVLYKQNGIDYTTFHWEIKGKEILLFSVSVSPVNVMEEKSSVNKFVYKLVKN